MRFLLDECPAPSIAERLREIGHDAVHVDDRGLGGHPDADVMAMAETERRILISADTDFGELLAVGHVVAPGVILLRRSDKRAQYR